MLLLEFVIFERNFRVASRVRARNSEAKISRNLGGIWRKFQTKFGWLRHETLVPARASGFVDCRSIRVNRGPTDSAKWAGSPPERVGSRAQGGRGEGRAHNTGQILRAVNVAKGVHCVEGSARL